MEAEYKNTLNKLSNIRGKYPTRHPILIEHDGKVIKILAEGKNTIEQIITSARRNTEIEKDEDVYLCVDNYEISDNKTVNMAVQDHGDRGILKCTLRREISMTDDEKKTLGDWIILM